MTRRRLLNIIRTMTQRTSKVILQIPLLETLAMEHVEAFQLADLLRLEYWFEADDAGDLACMYLVSCKCWADVPVDLPITTLGLCRSQRALE